MAHKHWMVRVMLYYPIPTNACAPQSDLVLEKWPSCPIFVTHETGCAEQQSGNTVAQTWWKPHWQASDSFSCIQENASATRLRQAAFKDISKLNRKHMRKIRHHWSWRKSQFIALSCQLSWSKPILARICEGNKALLCKIKKLIPHPILWNDTTCFPGALHRLLVDVQISSE